MAQSQENVQIVISAKDEASRAISSVSKELGGLSSPIAIVQKGLGGLGGALSTFGAVAAGTAAAGVGALAVGMGAFVKSGLDFNNTLQQTEARLNAFTKDAKLTEQILEDVRKEAAKTPFEFDEMAQATAALIGPAKQADVAWQDMLKTAEVLAASNPMQGLEGATFALREAMGGDFLSLMDRFDIPRQTINKLKKQGLPNIEIVRRALKEMGLDADLVAKQAETMEGRWSTLNDTVTNLAATITKPIFDAASEGLGDLNAWLEANQPLLEDFARILAGKVSQAITGFVALARRVISAWSETASFTSSLAERIGAVLDTLLGWEEGIGPFQRAGIIVTTVFSTLWDWASITLPIALAALKTAWEGAIVPAWQATVDFWNTTLRPALETLGAWLAANIPQMVQEAKRVWDENIVPAWQATVTFWDEKLKPVLETLGAWLGVTIPAVVAEAKRVFDDDFIPALQRVLTEIEKLIKPEEGPLPKLATEIGTVNAAAKLIAQEGFQQMLLRAGETAKKVREDLVPALDDAKRLLGEIFGPILNVMAALGLLGGQSVTTGDELTNGVIVALYLLKELLLNEVTRALNFVDGLIDAFRLGVALLDVALDNLVLTIDAFIAVMRRVDIPGLKTFIDLATIALGLMRGTSDLTPPQQGAGGGPFAATATGYAAAAMPAVGIPVPRMPPLSMPAVTRGGVVAQTTFAITVDARGAVDPLAVEQAGYRGARAALEEAARANVGRRSVANLRLALERRAWSG
jgi:hypothetical protein